MYFKFKPILCLLMVIVFLFSITACAKDGKNTEESSLNETTKVNTSEKTKEVKEVKKFSITMPSDWYRAGWQALEEHLESKKEELGVSIEIEKISDKQVLAVRFASNQMPDFACYFGASTAITDLNGKVTIESIDGEWTKNYDLDTLKSSLYSIDGKIVGLPMDGTNLAGVLYNKKVFADLGLKTPKNWDEFLDVCEKVKAAGKIPVYYSGRDAWTLQIPTIIGFHREVKKRSLNDIMDDINTNKLKWSDLELYKDSIAKFLYLKDAGFINTDFLSNTYDEAQTAIAQGDAAMYIQASWVLDEINKKFPDKINDIGGFALPFDGNDYIVGWMPGPLMMTTGCNDKERGREFVNYLGSVEAQQVFFDAQPAIPTIKGININLYQASKDLYSIFTTEGRGGPIFQHFTKYNYGDYAPMHQDVLIGGCTVEEMMKKMDEEFVKNAIADGNPDFK